MKHVICRMVFIAIGLVVGGTSVQAQDIHHGYNAPKSKTGYTVPNARSMMGYNTTGNMDIDTMMQAHAKMAEAYTIMAQAQIMMMNAMRTGTMPTAPQQNDGMMQPQNIPMIQPQNNGMMGGDMMPQNEDN